MLANSDGYNSARESIGPSKKRQQQREYDEIVEALSAFFEGQGVTTPPPTPRPDKNHRPNPSNDRTGSCPGQTGSSFSEASAGHLETGSSF
jgi:hypothetical protein